MVTAVGFEVSLGGDGNVLELDGEYIIHFWINGWLTDQMTK